MNKAIHSSNRDDWGTPDWLFGWFDRRNGFDFDAAATAANALAEWPSDGLKDEWGENTWCNPPYGRSLTGKWVRRAYEQTRGHKCAVVLVPCRTSESWWEWADKATIRFEIRGRVRFKVRQLVRRSPPPSSCSPPGPTARRWSGRWTGTR